jgi:hypothetical protein
LAKSTVELVTEHSSVPSYFRLLDSLFFTAVVATAIANVVGDQP